MSDTGRSFPGADPHDAQQQLAAAKTKTMLQIGGPEMPLAEALSRLQTFVDIAPHSQEGRMAATLLAEMKRLNGIERRAREFHGERTRAGRTILDPRFGGAD